VLCHWKRCLVTITLVSRRQSNHIPVEPIKIQTCSQSFFNYFFPQIKLSTTVRIIFPAKPTVK